MYYVILFVSVLFYVEMTRASGLVKPSSVRCRYSNEEYVVDPNRPQNTCEMYGCSKDLNCQGTSQTGECYCKEGYARLFTLENLTGPCISIKNLFCASKLPPTKADCAKRKNEIYHEFASNYNCGNKCEDYGLLCYKLLPVWSPHCECKEKFARLPNGECVALEDPRCSALYTPSKETCERRGEVFNYMSACTSQRSCKYPDGRIPQTDVNCPAVMVPVCLCPEGYLRDLMDRCVLPSDCYVQVVYEE